MLPILFDQPFSQVDKIKRIQLEDRLSSLNLATQDIGLIRQPIDTTDDEELILYIDALPHTSRS